MSASREKRSRKGTQEELLQKQLAETAQKKAKTRKSVLTGIAVVLAVVLLIGSVVLFNGPFFLHNSVAVTTGSHELSPVMTRYFYYDAFQEIVSNGYGSMLTLMYGENVEISGLVQDDTTEATWADAVMDMTLENIRSTYAVYDKAMAEGYQLSEDGKAALDTSMQTVDLYAQMNGLTADDYLRGVYGKGAGMDTFEAYQTVLAIANEYSVSVSETFTYDEATLQAAYEADPSAYDVYTYRSYYVAADTTDDAGNKLEGDALTAAMDEAKAKAEELAAESKDNEEAYLAGCAELSGNDDHLKGNLTMRANVNQSNMSVSIRDWVTDPARVAGETAAIEYEGNGYYAVYYLGSSTNDYEALNVRSIFISAQTNDASGATLVDWDAADARLADLQADIEASADLLADMETLVANYSDDSTTASNGGITEKVGKGIFETAVDEWLFAEGREVGDTAVIQGATGYYFLYVEGFAGSYRNALVSQTLMLEDYNEWFEEVTAAATATEVEAGMKRMDKTIYTPASSGYGF
ncbi:MAG: peptidylprolyl isomerase [Oscillospiraceae bacterium]|nr:peptidylprolyl isomerase [Oscillospiraceae bacterium]